MIRRITSPLQIDSDCRQASCFFDKDLLQEETANQLGLALPAKLKGAVKKRRAEFIAGRYCAQAALAQLIDSPGSTNRDVTIGIGANRQPLWPSDFVGSITHTDGYASALVAPRNKVRALGLDSEVWIEADRADNVQQQILTDAEIYANHQHLFDSPLHYLTLVFSAKESLFKCLFPLVNRFFDFHAAAIFPVSSGAHTTGRFRFELRENLDAEFCPGYSGHGSYFVDNCRIHTAVILK